MNKIKIVSIIIVSMLIGLSATSLISAEKIDEKIDVEVKDWIGVVYPSVSIENQSVTFLVNITTIDNKTKYKVQDDLIIDLNITDNSGRDSFFFPRSLTYCAVLSRKINDVGLFPLQGLRNRLFAHTEFFSTVNVVDSTIGGGKANNITLTLRYSISEATYNNSGENLTLNLYIMGILPGDTNGVTDLIPIIIKEKVELEVNYAPLV